MTLPTAWGKSHLIASIAGALSQRGSKILSLQPSKELLEQNLAKYQGIGENAAVYSASMNTKEIGDVTFATLGSVKNMGAKFADMGFDKLLIDECHMYSRSSDGMLNKFIDQGAFKHVLGVTATPLKLQPGLTEWPSGAPYSKLVMLTSRTKTVNLFKDMIYVSQVKEMIDKQAWANIEYETYDYFEDKLQFNSTKSDFTEESINAVYLSDDLHGKILQKLEDLADRKSIVVFVPSISQAKQLSNVIPDSCCIYSGMPPKERAQYIRDFKSLKTRVLVNVGIVAVGFDHPRMDAILMARPTASLSVYYQIAGRLTRPHEDKTDGLFVDFAGNVSRFGPVQDFMFSDVSGKWELYGKDGVQLTGVPMHRIGEKKIIIKEGATRHSDGIFRFGRFNGEHVSEVPTWYLKWMLTEYDFRNDKTLRKLVMEQYDGRTDK